MPANLTSSKYNQVLKIAKMAHKEEMLSSKFEFDLVFVHLCKYNQICL